MPTRVETARRRAREAAMSPGRRFESSGDTPRRDVVVGDPQAPITTFFEILDRYGLLGDDGTLALDTHLVSIGDHFDYGGVRVARTAAQEGLMLLAWLAAHDETRTTIILGNHDLGRVGELVSFEDEGFRVAQERAAKIYAQSARAAEAAFLLDYPALPSAEIAARDFAAFDTAQRELVTALLQQDRFRIAVARGPHRLICHAGLTIDDLVAANVVATDAETIADGLQDVLRRAVAGWTGGAFEIPELHAPGNAKNGEGGGIFYHRAAVADGDAERFRGPYRRRFDPERLPRGITQIVGHVRDEKCRTLLAPWADERPAKDGPLRTLVVGAKSSYGFGVCEANEGEAAMVFVDGGMGYGGAPAYELLDVEAMKPLVAPMFDHTARFTARAENYDRARPRYPAIAIDYIRANAIRTASDVVVDLGAGTGLLAERFVELGDDVVLVEPNPDMIMYAQRRFEGRARIVSGSAEATTLPEKSVNLIVAGQAFHWFDATRAAAELRRIAANDAMLALVWNHRRLAGSTFLEGYEAFLVEWGTDYADVYSKYESDPDMRIVFGAPPPDPLYFENKQPLDRDGLVARILSCSYIPSADDPRHPAMRDAIDRLFDDHAIDDTVTLVYDTTVFLGRLD